MDTRFTTYLSAAGLSEGEALVYELLVQYGEMKAADVIRRSGLKRGNVYNILHSLGGMGLAEEFDKNGVAHFRPQHPNHLARILESKQEELARHHRALESILPELTSEFNKGIHKPTIQYFEGESGLEKAAYDSLNSSGEIYTYADVPAIYQHMKELNDTYVKKRQKIGKKKKILLFDSPEARALNEKNTKDSITEYRIITKPSDSIVETALEIYDNKVAYLSVSEKRKMAVIIEDQRVADFHKILFEGRWKQANPKQQPAAGSGTE